MNDDKCYIVDTVFTLECPISKKDVGKWVVIQDAQRDTEKSPFVYLVDRTKCRKLWWSEDARKAMLFNKQTAAEYQARRYHYNNVRVRQIVSMADGIKW